jgi:hypothetical protein
MKNRIIIAIACMYLLAACKKDVKDLPDVTQTGAGTFGAKVNGTLWAPQGFGPIPANDILQLTILGTDAFKINARNFASSPNETEFEIFVTGVNGPGTYQLNTTVSYPSYTSSFAYYVKRKVSPQNEWLTSATSTGTVTITKFDLNAKIVSGTFSFMAMNLYNAPEPLSVTEGRFDLQVK